jgi:hypothetical protein
MVPNAGSAQISTADFAANSENISEFHKKPTISATLRVSSQSNSKVLGTDSLHVTEQRIALHRIANAFRGAGNDQGFSESLAEIGFMDLIRTGLPETLRASGRRFGCAPDGGVDKRRRQGLAAPSIQKYIGLFLSRKAQNADRLPTTKPKDRVRRTPLAVRSPAVSGHTRIGIRGVAEGPLPDISSPMVGCDAGPMAPVP